MPADAPLPIVGVLEGQERQPKFLDRVEAANPEKIFLEDANKALGNVVALRLPHVRCRIRYAQKLDFILKIVCDELAAVIMPQGQSRGYVLAESSETVAHALANRFQRLETCASFDGVDADHLQGAVVNSEKYRCVAFLGRECLRHVRAPHVIHARGLDRPIMGLWTVRWPMRVGANQLFSRIRRSVRTGDVRMPLARRPAQIFR